jgi:hypothetical protein
MAHRAGRAHAAAHQLLDLIFSPGRWLVIAPSPSSLSWWGARRSPLLSAATAGWLLLAFLGLVVVYWAGNFHGFDLKGPQTSAHRVSRTMVIAAAVIIPLVLGLSADRGGAEWTSDGAAGPALT